MPDSDRTRPILWGRGDLTNVQKVIRVCVEPGVDPDRRIVGGAHGGTDAPAFAALNPNRTVPVWQEGTHALWESQAILRHLARRSGRLYGRGGREAAAVDRWLDRFVITLWSPVRTLFLQVWRDRTMGWEEARGSVAQAEAALAVLARQVEARGHAASPGLTIVGIALAIGINRLEGMAGPVTVPPVLAAWSAPLPACPGFAAATEAEPDMPGHRARGAA